MKTHISLVLLAFFITSFAPGDKVLMVEDAVKNKIISYDIKGNDGGTHYIKPVILILKNLTNSLQIVQIPNGMQITAEDSSNQDFIITKEELITLKPYENKSFPLYAMCIEHDDLAGSSEDFYRLHGYASANLRALAEFIQKSNSFGIESQHALWAVSDDSPVEDIVGYDTSLCRKLMELVSKVTGKSLPSIPASDDYKRNYYSRNLKLTMGGEVEYSFRERKTVTIAMFNKNNIVVRELFKENNVSPGYHKFNYEFDASVYTDDVYYIKLLANGDVKMSIEVKMYK